MIDDDAFITLLIYEMIRSENQIYDVYAALI